MTSVELALPEIERAPVTPAVFVERQARRLRRGDEPDAPGEGTYIARLGAAVLTGPDGSLSVDVVDGVARGELRLTGAAPQTFMGPRTDGDGVLLWATTPATDGDLLGGWIFAEDGTQRGAVLKRSIGDTSFTLMNSRTTSAIFETTTLAINPMITPQFVE